MTPPSRLSALGNQLIDIHIRLREQLADLRDGRVPAADLRVHCAAFCTAVTRHHTAEDADVFATLAAEYPELTPVLDELRADHRIVADALVRVRESPSPQELDTLAALLETHFTYEERKLVDALNRLTSDKDVELQLD
ncbi:hemerythrin domain-containing protein [Hamadaea tsunoensis]|uniref:hemerythrin domain-containing protein n=1 Tax=Hamadaea tsunoensis TaxID=53368 RepID=UPI000421CFFC|nr:hemerythrin domain-containing protein [Hamadaea tsunoensis]